ncbi:biotin--[acetyl-CoA-carboxylase] ligase [Lacticaseibacillus absianus]|uniref:biotin--[acetyl-CoA-carboxylase] ligase n=1 Tax=Lacticaseibacillus absianus TaxID=2729623 RepID=UPI0015C97306|nr:biotin--[acetyl-CoA-carboxylase] ligase [Lacticaseibacillus absianus]
MFAPSALTPWLHGDAEAITVTTYPTLDSTSTAARRALAAGATPPFAFIADTQTAGVGRRGKRFFSPATTGLYMTVAFAPPAALPLELLTPAAGVALQAAIQHQFGVTTQIKWVNDLLLAGHKVAGILAEAVPAPMRVLLGTGINLAPSAASPTTPIDLPLGTLLPTAPATDPRPQLAGTFLSDFFTLLQTPAAIMPAYRAHAAWLGERVTLTGAGAPASGRLVGFSDDGALQLTTANGSITAHTGSIRRAD